MPAALIAPLLLALLALLVPASADADAGAGAGPPVRMPMALGIQDDALLMPTVYGYLDGRPARRMAPAAALDRARSLGVTLVKLKAEWSSFEPTPGGVDLTPLSDAVDLARSRAMKVMVLVTGPAPAWAGPTRQRSAWKPDVRAFAAFAARVGAALHGRVESYAVWNEPNWPSSLRPRWLAATRYRALYRRAFAALRATDPGARIVLGNLAPMGTPEPSIPPLRFLRAVLCLDRQARPVRPCAPLEADGVGLHPYTLRWRPDYRGRTDDATTGSLDRLVGLLDAAAAAGALRTPDGSPMPVDLVEWGFHAHYPAIPEQLRSRYAVDGLRLACRQPRVRSLVWYQLAGPPRALPGHHSWDTGLLNAAGVPRPTFTALQTLAPLVCPLIPIGGPEP
jgi:hypothetical protein